ncbi:MAG: response regulator [Elusimicrobia bacterium]|nr:response regulator [Elusimicrobiota bacterium]
MQKPFPFNKPKILIIDDDKNICDLVTTALNLRNFETSHSLTPQEGLKKAAGTHPDLIILDIHLEASIDGLGLLSHLKEGASTKNIPVLMLTTADGMNNVEDAFKKGAAAYLPKPINLNRLTKKVESLLKENIKES